MIQGSSLGIERRSGMEFADDTQVDQKAQDDNDAQKHSQQQIMVRAGFTTAFLSTRFPRCRVHCCHYSPRLDWTRLD
jgi:hypothetical protein